MPWDDWTWPMIWRDTLLMLTWVLAVTTIIQAAIHLATAWVSGHQHAQTRLGPALTRRELSLGIKGIFRDAFDILLLLAVTWRVNFTDDPIVAVIAVGLTLTALAALWYGIQYIRVLRDEYWGHPAATIDATTEDVGEVRDRVRRIEKRMNGRSRS